jgi:pimeloyl-ACP methyl ester carboxylesterase
MKCLRPKDAGGFDLGDAAETVADELELQGIRQADVLGVSIGGSVALRLAVERPELVGRLVLAGALVRPSRTALSMQKAALRLVPKAKLLDAGVDRARMLGAIDALKTLDASASLRQVAAPTLVVVGSRDRAGLPAAQQLARDIPGARLEVIDGGGALLNTEAPAALADLTQRFLDGDG